MVAESGARLLDDRRRASRSSSSCSRAPRSSPRTCPRRACWRATASCDPEGLARAVQALGPRAVVVTGGHREAATDVLFDGERIVEIPGERHADGAAHGSGCTHSSTLAARLALGDDLADAAREAKRVAAEAVRDGLRGIGRGAGPVDVLGSGAHERQPGLRRGFDIIGR